MYVRWENLGETRPNNSWKVKNNQTRLRISTIFSLRGKNAVFGFWLTQWNRRSHKYLHLGALFQLDHGTVVNSTISTGTNMRCNRAIANIIHFIISVVVLHLSSVSLWFLNTEIRIGSSLKTTVLTIITWKTNNATAVEDSSLHGGIVTLRNHQNLLEGMRVNEELCQNYWLLMDIKHSPVTFLPGRMEKTMALLLVRLWELRLSWNHRCCSPITVKGRALA